jgi:hypothetical protein
VIVKNDGTPYATENAAKLGLTSRGLAVNEYEVRPATIKDIQGFGIFKIQQGATEQPSATVQPTPPPAQASVDDQIARKRAELDALEDAKAKQETPKSPAQPPEKYYRVRFQPKSSPEEERDVMLSVNCVPLIIPRNVETIIPERYKICADNAITIKYEQKPGESRKIAGEVLKFPYMLIGEATREEYLALKAAGDKATREDIERRQHEGQKK